MSRIFKHKISLPWEGPHASPLTNRSCTTVTGIAKGTMHRPIVWSEIFFSRGGVWDWYYATSHNLPRNNGIWRARKSHFHTRTFHTHTKKKNLPTVGGGTPPPPPLGRFAPSPWPPSTNPGCTKSVTDKAKGPMLPLIAVKENLGGVGDWYVPPHITYSLIMALT